MTLGYDYYYLVNGLKDSFTAPNGSSITYAYDGNSRLSAITIPGEGQIAYNTYQWNRPSKITLPGGSTIDYTYDPLMQVTSISAKDSGLNDLMTRTYQYSPAGNVQDKITEHGTYSYLYDGVDRLTAAVNPTIEDEAYTYDNLGNRLSSSDAAGTWSYNSNNELLDFGDASFEYDENGNTVVKTIGTHRGRL